VLGRTEPDWEIARASFVPPPRAAAEGTDAGRTRSKAAEGSFFLMRSATLRSTGDPSRAPGQGWLVPRNLLYCFDSSPIWSGGQSVNGMGKGRPPFMAGWWTFGKRAPQRPLLGADRNWRGESTWNFLSGAGDRRWGLVIASVPGSPWIGPGCDELVTSIQKLLRDPRQADFTPLCRNG